MTFDFCNPSAGGDHHDKRNDEPQPEKIARIKASTASTEITLSDARITFATSITAPVVYSTGDTNLVFSVHNLTVSPKAMSTAGQPLESPSLITVPDATISFATLITSPAPTWTPGETTLSFGVGNLTVIPVLSSTSHSSTTADISSSSVSVSSTLDSSVTASPTVQTSSTAGSHVQSHSISNSAVAGLGAGLAIAGLLLGIFIGFLVFRRYRKRQSPPVYIPQTEKGEIIPLNIRTADPILLEQFLLDPVPQSKISQELQFLGQLIQQHCETYYHLLPVHISESELAGHLSLLGIGNGRISGTKNTTALLMAPATRLTAIRYVIAKAVFGSTALVASPGLSLLPPGVSDMTSRIPSTEENTGNHRATEAALTQWRQLSAFLLHPNRSDRTPLVPSDDLLSVQEHKLAVALNACLKPFVKGREDQLHKQQSHLEQVIRECATFGYLLFSQPSEYRLRFENYEGSGIVVCPGLYKVVNDNGSSHQELVSAPVVESV
ncbi:hypothetical protein NPX13_g7113 [Xylaria arbuscula]|uniref:Uncharacterized protein n=1 Tax=Xylaria arbuscula TaxID=114810 RepID=A0A9W8TKR9_9PEZI|nr:hypothetical protein NPX13_g7113 [Xylaria arbuscula]